MIILTWQLARRKLRHHCFLQACIVFLELLNSWMKDFVEHLGESRSHLCCFACRSSKTWNGNVIAWSSGMAMPERRYHVFLFPTWSASACYISCSRQKKLLDLGCELFFPVSHF